MIKPDSYQTLRDFSGVIRRPYPTMDRFSGTLRHP